MQEKEKLLSFETRLKFIFSHSALKEGWDNPNVFQICALREMGTERERRQTIGRGLRLCVNQQGERLRGFDVNTLTVVATEGYEQFAENLQKEIETDTGIRFGVVEKHQFAPIAVVDAAGRTVALGVKQSEAIWKHLKDSGYVDAHGKIQDHLRKALKENTLELPDLLTDLQDKTQLTRRSLVRIVTGSGRLDDFKRNPQEFVELVAEAVNRTKRLALVDGIKYQRLGDEYYYAQELFETEELTGYLKNMLAATKCVYEHVV